MNSIFQKYKRKESCDKVKEWLKQYWDWRDEAQQKKITVGSPSFDGQPKGSLFDPDYRITDWVNAEREWKVRENLLQYISSKGDEHELYALILDYRFVHHHWKMDKVALELNIPKRTCEDMQTEALWEAAKICPDKRVLVSK
ncbi:MULTISPECIES: transcriptional regulator [Limosilactobacillus]|uniref:Transcriptional regulator n=1 Tax=Limosilactobacillus reuteri TaxID=1598 RepID=A0A256SU55_LIMRT|nr:MULTISPECIES: transcriptional regulator [Limosilactobacillus]MDE7040159.1 transcriptional regulator [Limosilactobacillus sp.]NDO57225.1 transcriptional regulator [Limosilactobacillus reuteri]OYS70330.1 transcriptional regulator [Limosilactobacillus reuteri]